MTVLMPKVPVRTDARGTGHERRPRVAAAGGRFCYCWPGVTLRTGSREYYYAALDREFPGLRERYQRRYGDRYRCLVPGVRRFWECFTGVCTTYGLPWEMAAITAGYRAGYEGQLSLFAER